jgi:hypothetical protein
MWQTLTVILVLLLALIYVVRYFVKMYVSETSACSGCGSACNCAELLVKDDQCSLNGILPTAKGEK